MGRGQIYILTFLCYTSIHTLRTAYSSAKSDIPQFINLQDTKYMGIVDALMLSFLGVGHFLHALKPIQKPVGSLWVAMILCALNYALIPGILSIKHLNNIYVLAILMSINGFLQSYTWPNLLMIINKQFNSDKHPILLGFWSTNANIGNVIGFFVFMLLRKSEIDSVWKVGLQIAALYALINGILIYFRIQQLPVAQTKQIKQKSFIQYKPIKKNRSLIGSRVNPLDSISQLQDQLLGGPCSVRSLKSQKSSNSSIFQTKSLATIRKIRNHIQQGSVKSIRLVEQPQKPAQTPLSILQVIKDPNVVLLTITFSLTKSVIYGIMLWLPNYFKSNQQLKQYAQQIPMAYDVAAIFGSIGIGYLFKKISNKGLVMIPFMIVLFICFLLLRFFYFHVVQQFIIVAIIGFCLGGIFNTLSGLVVIQLTKLIPQNLKMSSLGFYSALTMAAGNFITAFTQILIGFVIGKQRLCMVCLIMIAIISLKDGQISRAEVVVVQELQEGQDYYDQDSDKLSLQVDSPSPIKFKKSNSVTNK